MTTELISALFKRRSDVEAGGQSWESAPAESCADASHLKDLKFGAPSAQEWLRDMEPAPEEDSMADALQEGLNERGEAPAHAPAELSPEDEARLKELAESLAKMQDDFQKERQQLSGEREELKRREEELKAREAAVEQERERQRKLEEESRNYPVPAWLKDKKLKGTVNVACVGNAGVGKSLLINRLRRIRPHAEGWAPVGVKETTMEPTMYAFRNKREVRLWDLPGAGTEAFPSETYISTMGLRYFDKVVIVTAGRFTSTEVALRAELEQHKVPYYMVRTKVDIDVYNNGQDNGMCEQATLSQITEDLRQTHGVSHLYLVSLRDTEAYDMPALTSELFPSLKKVLDPNAPCFCPSAPSWNEPWAMPVVLGQVLAGIQGRWWDSYGAVYIVQGGEAHVTLREGQTALVPMQESSEGYVWWCQRWFLKMDNVKKALSTKELRWTPTNTRQDKPLIWWWAD